MVDAARTVDLGRYEDGSRIELPVPGAGGAHWLIGGSSGSGKTVLLRVLCAELAARYGHDMALIIADPHFVGFKPWQPRASCIAYGMDRAVDALGMLETEMRRRYQYMFERDIDEWAPDLVDEVGPYLVFIVDELAAVTLTVKDATARLLRLSSEIRKVGGGLVLATQSPKVRVIDNMVREQCPIRICLRTRSPEQTEAVLETRSYPAHMPDHPDGIPLDMPGGAFIDNGLRIRKGRAKAIDKTTEAAVVDMYAHETPDLGWPRVLHPPATEEM